MDFLKTEFSTNFVSEFLSLEYSKPDLTLKKSCRNSRTSNQRQHLHDNGMSKRNRAQCQFAVTISFRFLNLLSERTSVQENGLKTASNCNETATKSFLSRQTKLIKRLNRLLMQFDISGDDYQLGRSSAWTKISVCPIQLIRFASVYPQHSLRTRVKTTSLSTEI